LKPFSQNILHAGLLSQRRLWCLRGKRLQLQVSQPNSSFINPNEQFFLQLRNCGQSTIAGNCAGRSTGAAFKEDRELAGNCAGVSAKCRSAGSCAGFTAEASEHEHISQPLLSFLNPPGQYIAQMGLIPQSSREAGLL
jgi:hypothetical protein